MHFSSLSLNICVKGKKKLHFCKEACDYVFQVGVDSNPRVGGLWSQCEQDLRWLFVWVLLVVCIGLVCLYVSMFVCMSL